jgi:hypothetical protein
MIATSSVQGGKSLTQKPKKPAENPYKILYWMGAGLLALAFGVVALIVYMPDPGPPPDPVRTLLYIYDGSNKGAPAVAGVVEEAIKAQKLTIVAFAPPEAIRTLFAEKGARATRLQVEAKVGRKIRHHLFLPEQVAATLIDKSAPISIDGKTLGGADAIAYMKQGGEEAPRRGTMVMLGLAQSVRTHGVNMGFSEGIGLLGQVDLTYDPTAIPDVLGGWLTYGEKRIEQAPPEGGAIGKLLLPDPEVKP